MNEEYSLSESETHPAAEMAMEWFRDYQANCTEQWLAARGGIVTAAASGDSPARIMLSTIARLENGDPVSDRYLLGLCWVLRDSLLRIPENS